MNIQRQFTKMAIKGGGDDAKVAILLNGFDEVDKVLTKVIEASKSWRDAWISILSLQLGIVTDFEDLYNPIVGAQSGGLKHEPIITPRDLVQRTFHLKEAFNGLKTDLLEEFNMMDARIIKPATEAKEYLQPLKRVIKKREGKRLDVERYQERVKHAQKKQNRTEREDAALARAEEDLSKASDTFHVSDTHVQETLPPIIAAAFSLLPHLLSAQILTQNTLLAQYYTVLHNYCQEEGFPSPPPPMEEVISQWSSDFEHIKTETESIYTIARGKAVHAPMHLGGDPTNRESSSVTGLNIRSNFAARRTPSQPTTTPALGVASQNPRGRGMMIPSTNTISQSKKVRQQECDEPAPEDAPTTSSQRSPYPVQSPAVVARDFTQHKPSSSNGSTLGSSLSPNTGIAAGKKKAPPPPPKRIGSNTGMWVTALYSFKGQEGGDLSFEVGDRIKVVKKTESTDDWWEGELKGMRGKFPANYCEGA